MENLECKQSEPTVVYEDNQAAICVAPNPQYHNKKKHIDIKYHFVREKVADNTIQLKYCPTNEMLADMLTKRITYEKSATLRNKCGVKDMSACKGEGVLESPLFPDELFIYLCSLLYHCLFISSLLYSYISYNVRTLLLYSYLLLCLCCSLKL